MAKPTDAGDNSARTSNKSDKGFLSVITEELNAIRRDMNVVPGGKQQQDHGVIDFGKSGDIYGGTQGGGKSGEAAKAAGKGIGAIIASAEAGASKGGGPGDNNKPNPNWKDMQQAVQAALKALNENADAMQKFQQNPLGDIKPSGVDQGQVGDCFFESALASLANSEQGQKTIQNMIKQNADGSYTVTFPGDKSNPVTVSQADLDKNLKNGNVVDSALWARVVETAFQKYDGAGVYGSGFLKQEGIPLIGKVSQTGKALELLTGQSEATSSLGYLNIDNHAITLGKTSKENVARILQDALKKGEPITAGADNNFLKYVGMNNSGDMVGEHVYSVVGYDSKTGTVTVRNPWGSNDGTPYATPGVTKDGVTSLPDGELKMSLDTFMNRFSDINVAGSNPIVNEFSNTGHDIANTLGHLGDAGSQLIHGNFGKAGSDLLNAAGGWVQYNEDALQTVTDLGFRGVNTVVGTVVDAGSTVVNKVEEGGKTVIHYLNPLNW